MQGSKVGFDRVLSRLQRPFKSGYPDCAYCNLLTVPHRTCATQRASYVRPGMGASINTSINKLLGSLDRAWRNVDVLLGPRDVDCRDRDLLPKPAVRISMCIL